MNLLKLLFISIAVSIGNSAMAQHFLKKQNATSLSFKEMQKQFNEWKITHDLKKEKGWKHYKRWEHEMLMHTDATGEIADQSIFLNEAIKAIEDKQLRAGENNNANFMSAAWTPTGPNVLPTNITGYMENGIGRINCIAFHPTNASTFFIGVAQGGVWKTTNGGTSWTPLTDNLPILRISDIAIDPTNVNTMYISVCDFEYIDVALNLDARKRHTHYGLGVYKTTNGGTTWQPTGLSFQLTDGDESLIRKIIVNPANPNQLVACGVSGMYTSSNGGTSWNHTMDTLFWDMVQDPVNPNTLYAASGWLNISQRGYAAIYKSTNFGASWVKLNTGIPTSGVVQRLKLAIAPSDNNYIYACAVDIMEGLHGFYKSSDAGNTWQYINPGINVLGYDDGTQPGGQGTYDLGLTIDKLNKNKIYVGGVCLYSSLDGAQTFDPAGHWTSFYGPSIHADIHFMETHPTTGEIFVCADGGLYKTSNIISQTWTDANNGIPWPTQWTKLNDGMQITSFYRLCSSKNIADRLVAGAQDNATFYKDGSSWTTIFGGDGMDNYLDPLDDDMVIGGSQYGNFFFSTDDGVTDNGGLPNPNNEPGEWVTPIIADYNNPGVLYAGYVNVTKSVDNGVNWTALPSLPSNGINDNEITALAIANSNSNVLYAARRIRYELNSPSGFYKTTNGGNSWTDVTAGLPDSLYLTGIDVSQTNANTVYVSVAGFSAGVKVFRSTNGGTNWQNISYNLPNIPVNCIKTTPGSNVLMIATDLGIYLFNSTTNTWTAQNTGLPNVIVSDIDFNPTLNKVYIATFGRGIWETSLSDLVGVVNYSLNQNVGIKLFPSPNNGNFSIEIENVDFINTSLTLDIIDITGKLVFTSQIAGQKIHFKSFQLPTGMYFAKISGDKLYGVKNFMVE